jgi:DNA polymerase-3 subunit gamma/tau
VRDEALKHTSLPVAETEKAKSLARDLPMPALQRAWSLLLKGLQEAQYAPDTRAAAQMAVMRLIYAADLPDPARLIRDIQSGAASIQQGGGAMERPGAGASVHAPQASRDNHSPMLMSVAGGGAVAVARAEPVVMPDVSAQPQSFEELVTLCEDKGEMLLATQLVNYAHPVKFEAGRFEFRPAPDAPANMAQRLGTLLQGWTGSRWMISLSTAEGAATLSQKKQDARAAERKTVLESANVQAVIAAFPGAELHRIIKEDR